MASLSPAVPPLTFPIKKSQLAIANYLYAHVLGPRILTNAHIAAIRLNANSIAITHKTIADITAQTQKLIRQARAYGEYKHNLTAEQRAERDIWEDYMALEWCASEVMTLAEFGLCVSNWGFMERLRIEGEWLQREVLEYGWRAYWEIPLGIRMGMFALNGDDGDEAMGDSMDVDFD